MKRFQKVIPLLFAAALFCGCMESTATKSVIAQIDQIGEVTLESSASIQEARSAYEALTDKEKESVQNYRILQSAEDALIAAQVDSMIEAIGPIDETSGEIIEAARTAYSKLTKAQKALVQMVDVLSEKENEYNQYLVRKVVELFDELGGSSITLDDIHQAEVLYQKLDERQQTTFKEYYANADAEILKAKAVYAQHLIDKLSYKSGKPSQQELNQLLEVQQICMEIGDTNVISNYKAYTKLLNAYKNYQNKNPRLIRQKYILSCEDIPYASLVSYPSQHKGETLQFNIIVKKIEPGVMLFPDTVTAVLQGDDKEVIFTDERSTKEPKLKENQSLTLYGSFDGAKTIKVMDEHSGLLGTPLFQKTADTYDVPVLKMQYCSLDYENDNSDYVNLETQLNIILGIE